MAYIGRQLVRGQNRIYDDISSSFNGSTTAFNLTIGGDATPPAQVNQLWIILGGILQKPGTDFTVADAQVTFTTAPAAGLDFWAMIQGDTSDMNAPSDGSVTPTKIATSGDFAFPADVRFKDADGSHYVGLQAPTTVSSNLVWTLPAADGGANQVLKTNGSGVLGWASDANAPEGTAVLSTGETGTTKYLRVDGDNTCSWQLAVDATKTTLTGSTNNTITTVTGANAIQGEANLTFDGDNLIQTIDSSGEGIQINSTTDVYPQFTFKSNRGANNNALGYITSLWNGKEIGFISFNAGNDTTNKDNGSIRFGTSSANNVAEKMRISPDGKIGIGETSPDEILHINSGTSNGCLKLESTDAQADLYIVDNSGQVALSANGDNLLFQNTGSQTERMRMDSVGRLIVGHTASVNQWGTGRKIQLHGTDGANSSYGAIRWSDNASGPSIHFAKSRGGIGTQTIVQDNDNIGGLAFLASDGTDFNNDVARIDCYIDGTPASNVVPGELVFSTTKSTGQAYQNMKIRNDGNVEISNGNVVIGTAGKGIDFSAQTPASQTGSTTGDETLDHYEEGTWTPLVYSTSTGNFTHSSQLGVYTRIGSWCFCSGLVNATVGGTEAGAVRIGQLPYNSSNTSANYGQFHTTDYGNFDSYTGTVGGYLQKGNSYVVLLHTTEASSTTIATSDWGSGTYIYFNINYKVA